MLHICHGARRYVHGRAPRGIHICHAATTPGWFEAVNFVRSEVGAWVKSSEKKHLPAGYPLVTVLLCLGDDRAVFEHFLEHSLGKALKD
eukprot:4287414-Pyramimonas_sp.AAC.1